jgi:hypothetical protein
MMVCAALASVAHAANAPEWLRAASKVDLGQFASGSAAVVVVQSTDFTVDAAGKFVQTERRAIRVLNRQAADEYLRAYGEESSDVKVVSIQSWSISAGGRIVQSEKKDINTQGAFASFELFSDARVKYVNIPGADENSLVGFEIVREGRLPIQGEQFAMEDTIPIKQAEVRVSVPSGSLRWFVNHPDRIEVVSQSPTAATFRSVDRHSAGAGCATLAVCGYVRDCELRSRRGGGNSILAGCRPGRLSSECGCGKIQCGYSRGS